MVGFSPIRPMELYRRAAESVAKLERVSSDVQQLVELLARPRPAPPPMRHFVQLLALAAVEAEDRPGVLRAVGGTCGELVDARVEQLTLQFDVQRPIVDVELLVFCDLSRVQVDGIFIGHDALALNLASGVPIAWAARAHPGQRVTANVRIR